MRRTVLLIDNSADNFAWCRQALGQIRDIDYTVIQAASASEALARIYGERPDCTLINWQLPGSGAVAALHRIRSRHPLMPVIMLTGGEASRQLEGMRSAGECSVLTSASTPPALHAAVDQAIGEAEARKASAKIAAMSQTVLVIDDDADDREFCIHALRQADERYRIIEAEGGEAGLALIEAHRPDCVLLDYSLPGQSGLVVLRRILAIDAFLPVIMLTGQGDEEIAVQAIKGGAHNYLLKSSVTSALLNQAVVSAVAHAEMERRITQQREQIYEQKLALAETSQLTMTILDNAPCLILATDASGKVLVFNKEAEHVLGYSADEVVGKHTPALWSPYSPIMERVKALAGSGNAKGRVDGLEGATLPERAAPSGNDLHPQRWRRSSGERARP